VLRSLLESSCNVLVRALHRGGQLPRARLRILEELGQPGVDLRATHRISRLVGPCREQRVGEADSISVEVDDARLDGGRQACVASHSGRCLGNRDGRMRVRSWARR
jgi:hypothetical protein